jgi:chromosome partitioning protein
MVLIIQRNVKLLEAPSFGESIINMTQQVKERQNYLHLAQEVIKKTANSMAKSNKKNKP